MFCCDSDNLCGVLVCVCVLGWLIIKQRMVHHWLTTPHRVSRHLLHLRDFTLPWKMMCPAWVDHCYRHQHPRRPYYHVLLTAISNHRECHSAHLQPLNSIEHLHWTTHFPSSHHRLMGLLWWGMAAIEEIEILSAHHGSDRWQHPGSPSCQIHHPSRTILVLYS